MHFVSLDADWSDRLQCPELLAAQRHSHRGSCGGARLLRRWRAGWKSRQARQHAVTKRASPHRMVNDSSIPEWVENPIKPWPPLIPYIRPPPA